MIMYCTTILMDGYSNNARLYLAVSVNTVKRKQSLYMAAV